MSDEGLITGVTTGLVEAVAGASLVPLLLIGGLLYCCCCRGEGASQGYNTSGRTGNWFGARYGNDDSDSARNSHSNNSFGRSASFGSGGS